MGVNGAHGPRVALLYFDGCRNWHVADKRLRRALTESGHGGTAVEYGTVSTAEEAEAAQFRGSPTVLIDGRDPFLDRTARSAYPAGSTAHQTAWPGRRPSSNW